MISPLHGKGFPFELASNIVYFHDWRWVHSGGFCWRTADGEQVPSWTRDPIPPMHYEPQDMPKGIHLEVQPASKGDPVLRNGQDDLIMFAGSVIHEEGRYRLWYECWPLEDFDKPNMGNSDYLCYAESDNGVDWRKPSLGLIERLGSKDNNLVYGRSLTNGTTFHGCDIFKDSSAPAAERYKMVYKAEIPAEAVETYRRTRPGEMDPASGESSAVCGAVSPDGLRWKVLPDPLVMQMSDTHNVGEYDVTLGKYVIYGRLFYMNRRTIGRMESDDFRRFPLPEIVFGTHPQMRPCDTWYANAKTLMPGTTDYHIMFPLRWRLTEDAFDFHLAASPDNMHWWHVSDEPVCRAGDANDWDGGGVVPGIGMVNLPHDRMGILFCGCHIPHKHPRQPPYGALAWASWPKGRLVALKAPFEGSFTIWSIKFRGRTVHLNLKTAISGFVKVEAIGANSEVIPGRAFSDCDPVNGNHLDQTVTWNGVSDIGHGQDEPVMLRFQMRSAELFSVEFK